MGKVSSLALHLMVLVLVVSGGSWCSVLFAGPDWVAS